MGCCPFRFGPAVRTLLPTTPETRGDATVSAQASVVLFARRAERFAEPLRALESSGRSPGSGSSTRRSKSSTKVRSCSRSKKRCRAHASTDASRRWTVRGRLAASGSRVTTRSSRCQRRARAPDGLTGAELCQGGRGAADSRYDQLGVELEERGRARSGGSAPRDGEGSGASTRRPARRGGGRRRRRGGGRGAALPARAPARAPRPCTPAAGPPARVRCAPARTR